MEEGSTTSGKLVTQLSELPEGKVFLSPMGNRVVRTSATTVKFGEDRVIQIKETTKEALLKVEGEKSPKAPRRRRAASQLDSSTSNETTLSEKPTTKQKELTPKRTSSDSKAKASNKPENRLGALDLSTGSRIIQSIKSAIGSKPDKVAPTAIRSPQLLPGEQELFVCQDVEYVVSDSVVHPGTIFLTTYQLLFRSSDTRQSIREVSLAPLGKIYRIEKVGGKKSSLLSASLTRQLVIHCKDFHKSIVIRMASANAGQRKQLFELMNKRAFPGNVTSLFAFSYTPAWSHPAKVCSPSLLTHLRSDGNIGINGWDIFSFESEFRRIGVFERMVRGHAAWRWSDVNVGYGLCKSYPERFVVPDAISDQQLQKVASFRTQSRIPMLSWLHKNGASITRCSQPKSGLVTARCAEDELLLSLIRDTVESDQFPLVIIDPRPRTNAEANRAVGAGYEKEANYAKTKVHFMGIGNIHVVRDSQQTLATLCANISSRTDSMWLSGVEGTGWLKHVKSILSAATLITKCVSHHGASCLVHCSDGWDRTSQVVSLAMLCMDPFYRTISGFCVLVEKEWCRAGHMFATRHGHGSKNYSEDARAPIFLQWIDCVYQVFRQFVTSFEFNENFLIRVVDEVCNCRFGTFIADNEATQRELDLQNKTVSLWTYIHHKDNFYRFTNPLYSPPVNSSTLGSKTPVVLIPKCSVFALSFWSNSYLQGSNFRDRSLEMSMERAFEMTCKIEDLELRIAELELENSVLKGIPILSSSSSATSSASTLNRSHSPVLPSSPRTTHVSSSSRTKNAASPAIEEPEDHDSDIEPEVDTSEDPEGVRLLQLQATHRSSGEVALDQIVDDLTKVGEASSRSTTAPTSTESSPVKSPENTTLEPTSPEELEAHTPRTAFPAPSAVHRSNLIIAASSLARVPIPATSSTPEPAILPNHPRSPHDISSSAYGPPTLYVDEDIDWGEALSMDAPKVRGDPQWGSASMMIEDYAGPGSGKIQPDSTP